MMKASKWLQLQVLLDGDEMEQLFALLGPFRIYRVGAVLPVNETEMTQKSFLEAYKAYVNPLKEGKAPPEFFTSVFTLNPEALHFIPLEGMKQIAQIIRPVVQVQIHRLGYAQEEVTFKPMVKGKGSIAWGVQFSYPQLFQDGEEVYKVDMSNHFPNTELFHGIQKWIRQSTIPTPFIVNGKKINLPIRLGKKCLGWINHHPGLIEKNLKVAL